MPALGLALGLPFSRSPSASFVGALDAYTAGMAAVWSVRRRLLTSYTGPLFEVRRSSDGAFLNIGALANGSVNTSALLTFCGSGDGFVSRIYDQSSLARDYYQSSASAQRRIVNAGVLETLNSLPTLKATSLAQGYTTDTFTANTGNLLSVFASCSMADSQANARLMTLCLDGNNDFSTAGMIALTRQSSDAKISTSINDGVLQINEIAFTYDAPMGISTVCDGSNNTLRQGATAVVFGMDLHMNVNRFLLSSYSAANPYSGNGDKWSEGAAYFANKTADEAAIRAILTP